MRPAKRNRQTNSQSGSYLIEIALLLPVLVGFSLGLIEAINIFRAQSALNESINFGNRELTTVAGQGVKMGAPTNAQTFDWYQFRKVNNIISKQLIASNKSGIPSICNAKNSSNLGCSRELRELPTQSNYSTLSFDTSKILNELIRKEALVSGLPELKFNCANHQQRGCFYSQAQFIPGTTEKLPSYFIELSYNVPTPFLGTIFNRPFIKLTANSVYEIESSLKNTNPMVISGDADEIYGDE